MGQARLFPLSALLENSVQPNPDWGIESAADACLKANEFEQAASSYYQLDAGEPRIASKVAYCEWMIGNSESALDHLTSLGEDLDADGVSLLSTLVCTRYGDKKRDANMEAIWPRLKALTSSDTVPLMAAEARSQVMWPGDIENREQRRKELERLLDLHPTSQRIRLEVLSEWQCARVPVDQQYGLLDSLINSTLMPRYQWEAARVAAETRRFDEAVDHLNQLERIERESARPSQNLLLNIDLARSDLAARSTGESDLSGFEKILRDTPLDWDDSARVVRAALATACNAAPTRIAELCDRLLTTIEATSYGFSIDASALFNDAYPVSGYDWDDYAHTWPCGDLFPHKDVLLAKSQGRANQFLRAAFAAAKIDEIFIDEDDVPSLPKEFWDDVAAILGDIAEDDSEFGGRLLSLHTAVRAHRHRPNWTSIAQGWIASELLCDSDDCAGTHGWLTLKAATRTATSARTFTSGVLKQLRDSEIVAPKSYDLVESLFSRLVNVSATDAYRLMTVVSQEDTRPDVQFYLGCVHTTVV